MREAPRRALGVMRFVSLLIPPVHCTFAHNDVDRAALSGGDFGGRGGECATARLHAGRVGAGAGGGAIAASREASRVSAGGHGLAGDDVRATPERHPRGRDGPGQDDPNDRVARTSGL